ncbi:transcriptional regulator [Haemophilus parainfluenzae]|nr:transcriptional regulator [Haemophilus parainfluenzae]
MEIALNLLSGKWRLKILYYLLKGESIHFNQLQRLLGDITTKVLTAQLRTLEEAGIVSRVVYDESPIRVKYSMTDTGKTLIPLMTELCNWGKTYKKSRLLS